MRLIRCSLLALFTGSFTAACATGECADAIDYADECGVHDLELEDDVAGCSEHWECRSRCVLDASCVDVSKTFGPQKDRNTPLWACYERCPISS